jgi:VIT1/CCC1 family predicted Fe2+/Mn2+ transporter
MDSNHLHVGATHGLAPPLDHARPRLHGLAELARHYLRDLVYGANDGIITTFAVVTGVTGASLGRRTILILGIANLLADGFSMGASNYLSIRSDEAVREARGEPVLEAFPQWHALATLVAFVVVGAVPLLPYLLAPPGARFPVAVAGTLATLFAIGALRSAITRLCWWKAGLEMLLIGAMAAGLAYGAGRFLATLT